MSKRVLLIGHNFAPEPTGIGKYSGDMMEWLAKNGFECTVITTFPYYPYWKVQAPYKNRWYKKEVTKYPQGNKLTVLRCPSYIPEKPTGKKRMLQDLSFWSSMFWMVLGQILFRKKHDYIITIAPPFHLGFLALLYKKLKGGKMIYHIQDLQIEAARDLNMLSNEKLFNYVFAAEKKLLVASDYVSSISDGMIRKIRLKVDKDILFFPNWVDVSSFFPISDKAGLKEQWGYDKDDFVCLYSGSIGQKQGLENIIYCADILKSDPHIKFIICGTGPYKYQLEDMVKEKGLNNVAFLPLQDREVFNKFLNMADAHLVIQKGNASDLVMPSKLTTILSIGGLSIITTPPDTSLDELVKKYEVGIAILPDDYEALKDSILAVATGDFSQQRKNARQYAEQYLNIDNVMGKFLKDIGN